MAEDSELLLAVEHLKQVYLTKSQGLIHGDLHAGAFMVHESSTMVLDPEFAFIGPIGFDIGRCLASIFSNYFSQTFHNGTRYSEYMLEQACNVWNTIAAKFTQNWDELKVKGSLFSRLEGHTVKVAQKMFLDDVFKDTVGFIGTNMHSFIVGCKGEEGVFEDYEMISKKDVNLKAMLDKKMTVMAVRLIKWSVNGENGKLPQGISTIESLCAMARAMYQRDVTIDDYSSPWQ